VILTSFRQSALFGKNWLKTAEQKCKINLPHFAVFKDVTAE
jgi:hypothetical protein